MAPTLCSRSNLSFSFSTKLVLVPVLVDCPRVSLPWVLWSLGGTGGGGGGAGAGAGMGAGFWVGTETVTGAGAAIAVLVVLLVLLVLL